MRVENSSSILRPTRCDITTYINIKMCEEAFEKDARISTFFDQ